jgi:Fe-S cluster biogenesis protein NfuA
MFIQTEVTPNPQTLKFLPGETVLGDGGTRDYQSAEEAAESPLAERLFAVAGVTGVFLGSDFVSVSKDDGDWQHLKPAVLGAIMEHYLSGAPVLADDRVPEAGGAEFYRPEDEGTVTMIKELINERVRPAVAGDGGDIIFKGYKEGVVYLSMRGACAGCPSSTMTLQMGIQNLLRHFVPEVEEVRPV